MKVSASKLEPPPVLPKSTVQNADVARAFGEIADLLEIDDANPFRIRAYRNAARVVGELKENVAELIERDEDLSELPGIGVDLSSKIHEIVDTGQSNLLQELRKGTPRTLVDLLKVPGLGPKRVKALYQELDVHNLDQLARAALDGRISRLPGFGEKLEKQLLEASLFRSTKDKRFRLPIAEQYANAIVAYLSRARGVSDLVVAGSFRRSKETVGDLDILVSGEPGSNVIEHFTKYREAEKVLSQGQTRASVLLKSGLQVDLRFIAPESFGAALLNFTGSKAHNVALRTLAQEAGLKLNEYGVFRDNERIAGETEESVFRSLGLPYIEPELRENQGEIQAALEGRLPQLIELSDIRGDLHSHTSATDGHNSLEQMAFAAKMRGYEYLAITDHSVRLSITRGLNPERLLAQIRAIDALNKKLHGVHLLRSIEVDILEDGSLDLPDDVLRLLDLVVGSIHSKFHLSRQQQTKRMLHAMGNKYLTIIGHPTGRLIGERDPYDVDMPAIIREAHERGVFLELNAHPERLDLMDSHCRMAKEARVLIAIDTDAHSADELDLLEHGLGQARRGWLEKQDVLNTRHLPELKKLLRQRRA